MVVILERKNNYIIECQEYGILIALPITKDNGRNELDRVAAE